MNIDNALNVQAEILEGIFGYTKVPGASSATLSGAPIFAPGPEVFGDNEIFQTDPVEPKTFRGLDARRFVGVGIRPPKREETRSDYKILIRCQREQDLDSDFVRAAIERARGEAIVTHTGLVFALSNNTGLSTGTSTTPKIGDSTSHYQASSGTIGAFVRANGHNGLHVLSNNHVLANCNNCSVGDEVIHPGSDDGGSTPSNKIARLSRYEHISFNPSIVNTVDAAIAPIEDGINVHDRQISGLPSGRSMISGQTSVIVNSESVEKVGRTTHGTSGTVEGINESVAPSFYVNGYWRQAQFVDQISISGSNGTSFSEKGDSGSTIYNDNMDMVGLLFAGSDLKLSYANPIDRVLSALQAWL